MVSFDLMGTSSRSTIHHNLQQQQHSTKSMTCRWTISLDSIDHLLTTKGLTLLGRGSPTSTDPTTRALTSPATPACAQPTKQEHVTLANSSDDIVSNRKQQDVAKRSSRTWNKNAVNRHPPVKSYSTATVKRCDEVGMERDKPITSGLAEPDETPSNKQSHEVSLPSKPETRFNYPEVHALQTSGRQAKADVNGSEKEGVLSEDVSSDQGLASHRARRNQGTRVPAEGVQRAPMPIFIDEKLAYDSYARRQPLPRKGNATVGYSYGSLRKTILTTK